MLGTKGGFVPSETRSKRI